MPLLIPLRNDCQNKQDPKQTARNMAEMLDEIYQRWPDTTVILSTLVRSGSSDSAIVSCTAAVSQEYRSLVYGKYRGYRIALANIHDAIQLNQIADGIHPNDEGYKLFAAVWANAINRVVDKIKPPVNDGTVDDSKVGGGSSGNTCKKVAGNAKGPFKTQQGSGEDDGNYVHKSTSRGMVIEIPKNRVETRYYGDIRDDIWLKLWGNLCFNPISALTRATLDVVATDPGTRALAKAMNNKNARAVLTITFGWLSKYCDFS